MAPLFLFFFFDDDDGGRCIARIEEHCGGRRKRLVKRREKPLDRTASAARLLLRLSLLRDVHFIHFHVNWSGSRTHHRSCRISRAGPRACARPPKKVTNPNGMQNPSDDDHRHGSWTRATTFEALLPLLLLFLFGAEKKLNPILGSSGRPAPLSVGPDHV